MLPPGPLVIVIVPGGADSTKRNTAPATTRTANRIAAMVMARLTPNISIIIVSRLGLVVGEPPAAGGPLKSVESLSLLISRQRSLPDPLEQGENPGHGNRSVTAGKWRSAAVSAAAARIAHGASLRVRGRTVLVAAAAETAALRRH